MKAAKYCPRKFTNLVGYRSAVPEVKEGNFRKISLNSEKRSRKYVSFKRPEVTKTIVLRVNPQIHNSELVLMRLVFIYDYK